MKYAVIYEVKLKGSRMLVDDNSLIVRDIDSLVKLKESIMYLHAVDPELHYVRITQICPLLHTWEIEERVEQIFSRLDLTFQTNQVILEE